MPDVQTYPLTSMSDTTPVQPYSEEELRVFDDEDWDMMLEGLKSSDIVDRLRATIAALKEEIAKRDEQLRHSHLTKTVTAFRNELAKKDAALTKIAASDFDEEMQAIAIEALKPLPTHTEP